MKLFALILILLCKKLTKVNIILANFILNTITIWTYYRIKLTCNSLTQKRNKRQNVTPYLLLINCFYSINVPA